MKPITLVVLLVFLSGGIAQSAPIAGVQLQSCEKNAEGEWIAHVVNVSHKEVETIAFFYGASEAAFNTTITPGETKDFTIGDSGEPNTTPAIGVVVYSDSTAEVADERTFQSVEQHRADSLLTLQQANTIIEKHKASTARIADTTKELEALAATQTQYRKTSGPTVQAPFLREMARELREGIISADDLAAENSKGIAHLEQKIVRLP